MTLEVRGVNVASVDNQKSRYRGAAKVVKGQPQEISPPNVPNIPPCLEPDCNRDQQAIDHEVKKCKCQQWKDDLIDSNSTGY